MKQTRVQRFASYRAHIQKMRSSNRPSIWSGPMHTIEHFFYKHDVILKVTLWSLLAILGAIVIGLFFFGRTVA